MDSYRRRACHCMSAHIIMKRHDYISNARTVVRQESVICEKKICFCLPDCKKIRLCLRVCVHSSVHYLRWNGKLLYLSISQGPIGVFVRCRFCIVAVWSLLGRWWWGGSSTENISSSSIWGLASSLNGPSEENRPWRDPEKCRQAARNHSWTPADTAIMFPLCLQKHPFGFCLLA